MTTDPSRDNLNCLDALTVGDDAYTYYSLKAAEKTLGDLSHLPCCMRLLLENLIRRENDNETSIEDMRTLCAFHALRRNPPSMAFAPVRLMAEGSAALSVATDLAAVRDCLNDEKQDPALLAPNCPTVLLPPAEKEVAPLFQWSRQTFPALRIVTDADGNGQRIAVDFLASIVAAQRAPGSEAPLVVPETALGTNKRLPALGGLGILAWQVNALDVESILLGNNVFLTLPGVLGINLTGKRPKTASGSDYATALLRAARQNGAAGKIVEFCGPGLDHLTVPDRLLIAETLVESGALSVLFPIDSQTVAHLAAMGAAPQHTALVEAYAKAQGLWHESWPHDAKQTPTFSALFEFSLETVRPLIGGPGLAYAPIALSEASKNFTESFPPPAAISLLAPLRHGDIAWVCLGPSGNADHPSELLAAALLARKARAHGLRLKPWTRAALVLKNPVLKTWLEQMELTKDLEEIGVVLVQDTAAIPPLLPGLAEAVEKGKLTAVALLSSLAAEQDVPGICGARYLASPAWALAFALAGTMTADIASKPFPHTGEEKTATIKELWPTAAELSALLEAHPLLPLYRTQRERLDAAPAPAPDLAVGNAPLYPWRADSLHLKKPSLLQAFTSEVPKPVNVVNARPLAVFGDNVTTRQIVPQGPIAPDSPAGRYLQSLGASAPLGTFESYAGNENVMVRGAFCSPDLTDALRAANSASLFERAEQGRKEGEPLILAAGANYSAGPGQEWAAKATRLLGVQIVIAESFAPEHRTALIRAGVLPLQIKTGVTVSDLKLESAISLAFAGISDFLAPPAEVMVTINHPDTVERYMLLCRLDTEAEMTLWRHGSLWAEAVRTLIMLAG